MNCSNNAIRVLAVDDDPGVLRAVERILRGSHEVRAHTSPSAALNDATEFRPEIAILDIRMPEMDGFTLQQRLREVAPEVDVILMTGSMTEPDELLTRSLRQGAFYFIHKPFRREVLEALVDRCIELRRLRAAERRNLQRMERELQSARALQLALVAPSTATVGDLRIRALHQPCTELGGDFVDYFTIGDSGLAFIVADVRGHGAPAALLTALVRSAFRSVSGPEFTPVAVIERLVNALRSFPPDQFATVFCGFLDSSRMTLRYCNAGHPAAELWTAGSKPTSLRTTGPLVSPVLADQGWEESVVTTSSGSQLLVYTDGLIEQRGAGDRFGRANLLALLEKSDSDVDLTRWIVEELNRFRGDWPLDDDWTMLHISDAGRS